MSDGQSEQAGSFKMAMGTKIPLITVPLKGNKVTASLRSEEHAEDSQLNVMLRSFPHRDPKRTGKFSHNTS